MAQKKQNPPKIVEDILSESQPVVEEPVAEVESADKPVAEPALVEVEEPKVEETKKVSKSRKGSEIEWQGKAKTTRDKIMAEPKIKFLVPLDINEKQGTILPVTINGWRLNIPKGIFIDLPQSIAVMLAEKYQITSEAGKEFDLSNEENQKRQDALI